VARPRYRSDGLLTRRTARRLTSPYTSILSDIVRGAWDDWTEVGKLAPGVRMRNRRLGRAVNLWEYMMSEAADALSGVGGCEIEKESQQTVLTFGDGELRVTFNKINPKRLRKPRSGRQLAIFRQDDVRSQVLPGMPRATWAKCGYVLDSTETKIERVVLACFRSGDPAWVIDLAERAARVAAPSATVVVPLASSAVPMPKIASAVPQAAPEGQTGTT